MSESSSFSAWLDRPAGYEFPPDAGCLNLTTQARQHAACDVPAKLFADRLDPTLLGQDMVLMASRDGLAVDGRVHVAHRIRQRAPLPLGIAYAVRGRIESRRAVPRGHEVKVLATAEAKPDSEAAVDLAALYLLPGVAPSAEAAPGHSAAPIDPASLSPIGQLRLTPERVMSYSADVGNLLHFDPPFAAARGFRAPIAQGLMLVTAFFGVLSRSRDAAPDAFVLGARFRRPAFWNDALEFHLGGERWCCTAADGRVLVDGEIVVSAVR